MQSFRVDIAVHQLKSKNRVCAGRDVRYHVPGFNREMEIRYLAALHTGQIKSVSPCFLVRPRLLSAGMVPSFPGSTEPFPGAGSGIDRIEMHIPRYFEVRQTVPGEPAATDLAARELVDGEVTGGLKCGGVSIATERTLVAFALAGAHPCSEAGSRTGGCRCSLRSCGRSAGMPRSPPGPSRTGPSPRLRRRSCCRQVLLWLRKRKGRGARALLIPGVRRSRSYVRTNGTVLVYELPSVVVMVQVAVKGGPVTQSSGEQRSGP